MTLSTADVRRLLPLFMRDDATVKALSDAADALIREPGSRTRSLSEWGNAEQMNDAELDELAWERGIDWYDSEAPIDQKRATIENAKLLKEKSGTIWAVTEAVRSAFGVDVALEEGTTYGAPLRHFRLHLTVPPGVAVDAERVRLIVEKVKRAACILDSVEIDAENEGGE